MSEFNYKKLQNGSDIRGISLTGVPGELPNRKPCDWQKAIFYGCVTKPENPLRI